MNTKYVIIIMALLILEAFITHRGSFWEFGPTCSSNLYVELDTKVFEMEEMHEVPWLEFQGQNNEAFEGTKLGNRYLFQKFSRRLVEWKCFDEEGDLARNDVISSPFHNKDSIFSRIGWLVPYLLTNLSAKNGMRLGALVLASFLPLVESYSLTSRTYGGTGYDEARGLVLDDDGGYFIAGWYYNAPVSGDTDAWVIKVDSGGTIVWDKKSNCNGPDYANAVEKTDDGGCIIAGYAASGCSSGNPQVGFVTRHYPNGNIKWRRFLASMDIVVNGIKNLGTGEYAIVGSRSNSQPFVIILRDNNSIQWYNRLGTTAEFFSAETAPGDRILIVGGESIRCIFTKYNSNGGHYFIIHPQYNSVYTRCPGITKLSDGNYLIIGYVYIDATQREDGWVMKVTDSGFYLWQKTFGHSNSIDKAWKAKEMPNGNIVGVGHKLSTSGGFTKLWYFTLDPAGNMIASRDYGSPVGNYAGYDIAVTTDSVVATTGYAWESSSRQIHFFIRAGASPGSFLSTLDDVCYQCDYGHYQPGINQPSCLQCDPGYFQNDLGQTSCDPCPEGKYQQYPGKSSCDLCDYGEYQGSTASTSCDDCAPGKYQNVQGQPSCLLCDEGTYQDDYGKSSCKDCDPGYYQDETGKSSCKICPVGEVQPSPGKSSCNICGPGYYQNEEGKTTCKACDPGEYQDDYGKSSCIACDAGTYQNEGGKASCKNCPEGEYQDDTGKTSCKLCDVGYFQNEPGKPNCIACDVGTYQNEQGKTSCKECDVGEYQDDTGKTSCKLCDVGYFQNEIGKASCTKCPVGKYQNEQGKDSCILCDPGTYQNEEGKTSCLNCGVMTYQNDYGKDACISCDPGYYQDQEGKASCDPCIAHCDECTSSTNCFLCFPPYKLHTPPTGPIGCFDPCPIHYYGDGNVCKECIARCEDCTDSTNCFKCESGYYVDVLSPGVAECVDHCRDGYFINYDNGFCETCLDGCKECVNTKQCLECFYPLSIKRDKETETDTCVADCGLRYYALPIRVCEPCDFRCLSCLDGTAEACPDCDTSKEGVVRVAPMTCDCGNGYAASLATGSCARCVDSLCKECNPDNPIECYKCIDTVPGIIQDPVTKTCTCTAGKYREGDDCRSCNVLCAECTGSTNRDCLESKCANKAYPLDYLRTTCLYMCSTPMDDLYLDPDELTCKPCVSPCKSCFAGTSESCTTCRTGFMLLGSSCVDGCPSKYYSDSGICLPCDPKCKDCVDRVNYCINGCEPPYLFKNHRCLTECGEGYTGVDGFCEPCDEGCAQCYYDGQRKVCTRCMMGKYLFAGVCSSTCPSGRYPDAETSICALCHEACAECFERTNKNCYSCNKTMGYIMIAENTCNFPTCTDGSYFNRTLKACASCPKECTQCENYRNCTMCAKGYTLDYKEKVCFDPCNKVGFTRKPGTYECMEICGDGRNMGLVECDDGNKRNGDGCNSNCKVEKFYECKGGDPEHADICVYRKPVEITSFRYFGNRSGVLTFATRVQLLEPLENLLEVSLERSNDPSVQWEYLPFNNKNFRQISFNFAYNHSLAGDEELVVRFKDPKKVMDMQENVMKKESVKTKVYRYKYISQADKKGAEGAGTASLYAMLPSIGLSLGLSLVLYFLN